MSIASMIMAVSVEFFPFVYANCWMGVTEISRSAFFQPDRLLVDQSP